MSNIASHELGAHQFHTFNQKPNHLDHLYEVNQVHSAEISLWNKVGLDSTESDGICFLYEQSKPLKQGTIHLAIKTADCLSVVILGNKGAINLHAGWRGLAKNILFHPFIKQCEPHSFLLSAAINEKNYEVGQDFKETFRQYSDGLFEDPQSKKLTFSLHKTAEQMIKSQYPNVKITKDDLDTFSHPDLNSFRRDKTVKRNWNVLSLNLENLNN